VKVTLEEVGNNTERMIKKFLKKVKKSGIIKEVFDRKFYKKPSVEKTEAERKRRKVLEELKKELNSEETHN
jgi:ribosomal protein S21